MKINIKGPIISDSDQWIYDWCGIPATSPSLVSKLMDKAEKNEELEIIINSGGGSVDSGTEIYSALKDYDGNVIGKIVGLAASAASVIAMGCTKLLMSPPARIMIHNSAIRTQGDHSDLEHTAGVLKTVDIGIANAYELKTGMSHAELLALMEDETWFDAKKALDNKLIDEIMFTETKIVNSAQTLSDGTLPQAVIDKIRNELKGKKGIVNSEEIPPEPTEPKVNNELVLAKLKLKLK
ncbi:MAG: head maturation protease, ClpP-related [Psychrilyobacter sp.]|uniref:head maturation protease, ClpP-related n=1 Tax=Psychrilyobacter sp. TaxID=2586924 RepID=UPI003C72A05B